MAIRRTSVPAPGIWGAKLGYSRAVRDGRDVWISATAPVDRDGRLVGAGDAAEQARHIMTIIRDALAQVGADLSDVVRTRVYLRSFENLDAVADVHRETFVRSPPACTVVAVADLVLPGMLVYIEAEARCRPSSKNEGDNP